MVSLSLSVVSATLNEAFDLQREEILSGKVFASEGYCFGIGKAKPRTQSSASAIACENRADLEARVNLICRKALQDVSWPEDLAQEDREKMAEKASKLLSLNATVSGVQRVYLKADTNAVRTVVVGVEESRLSAVPKVTYTQIQNLIEEANKPKVVAKTTEVKPVPTEPLKDDVEVLPVFVLPPYATGHQNETLGF